MLPTWVVLAASAAYLGLLVAVARYAERRADAGRSVIDRGGVYALSLAVYATSWTFYGSVGRATSTGLGFLPIYLGPTVAVVAWWVVLHRVIRICRRDRITSLSDFVAARYGSSAGLGALVAVVAVVGILPYLALQLKAVSTTLDVLVGTDPADTTALARTPPLLQDSALGVALLLAVFAVLFGVRRLDAAERHEGMVAAVAVESLVKLGALLAVGAWVAFGLFDSPAEIVRRAAADPDLAGLLTVGSAGGYGDWLWLVVLSALAVLLLPRQWQVAVVENVDERHLRTAAWAFPLYLLLVTLPVLPLALAGLLVLDPGVDPDVYVLALPLAEQQRALALLVFLGGLSAATGMVVVETVALSTMVSNSLVIPLLLRYGGRLARRDSLGGVVLTVRRVTVVVVLLLGVAFLRLAGEGRSLVSIGLVSFAAVAQVAPALLGGLFWRGATRRGAVAGTAAGFTVWAWTLLVPALADAGWLPASLPTEGPAGLDLLAPRALLGVTGLDEVTHAMTWSAIANVGLFVGVSLLGRRDPAERLQAARFVDVLGESAAAASGLRYRGSATVADLRALLERFLGPAGAGAALSAYRRPHGGPPPDLRPAQRADPGLVQHVEARLAGVLGATSARVLVASAAEQEPVGVREVMGILDETSRVLATSRALAAKSAELEAATAELRQANARLTELDRLKDDFVATVSHELRTPLTAIRASSEVLLDHPDVGPGEREALLRAVVAETARLTRLVDQVLDLAALESGQGEWRSATVDLTGVVRTAAAGVAPLALERGLHLDVAAPDGPVEVAADPDRVAQVVVNLLANALKVVTPGRGRVRVAVTADAGQARVAVADDGPGLSAAEQRVVFERFRQGEDGRRLGGTGLGLPISRGIVERLGGRLEVASEPGRGAVFSFVLPLVAAGDRGGDGSGAGPVPLTPGREA